MGWENHAKTTDAPKPLFKAAGELLPADGEPLALQNRRFAMFDQRPVTARLPVDPNQLSAHGRVTKLRPNDVPAAFQEAQLLSNRGRLMDASGILIKILETAQAHHKARRLLNQINQRLNQELQEGRKSKASQVSRDDDARAFRSRWYTPSMAQEEIIHGEAPPGKEAHDIPLRFSGSASPTRLPAGGRAAWDAPWLPAPARQPNLAPYATVASPSPLKAPPSRGKDAYIKPQTQPGARNQALLKEFSDHGPLDAWPAPAKDDSHLNEVDMWQRPATHAQQKHVPMSPSYDDEEDLSDLSARPAVPFTTRAYMDNDLDHLDDGAYSEEMREDLDKYGEDAPDYRNIFQDDYRQMIHDKEAARMRAQILRDGAYNRMMNRDSIITGAMERVNQRQIKFKTFADEKLNVGLAKRPLRDVGIGKGLPLTPDAPEGCACRAEREVRASAHFISRLRGAKKKPSKPKFDPAVWTSSHGPRELEIQQARA